MVFVGEGELGELEQKVRELPNPIGMKVYTPKQCKMQVAIIKNVLTGKSTIFKHYHFPSKVNMKGMERIAHGKIKVITWGDDSAETRKAFQRMVEKLGGYQVLLHKLVDPCARGVKRPAEAVLLTDSQIDEGYDFIRDEAQLAISFHSDTAHPLPEYQISRFVEPWLLG